MEMAKGRKRTDYPGVYETPHETKKHGVKKDRYIEITYRLDGKKKWESYGYVSKDCTPKKAFLILSELKENQKLGRGPQSLKEIKALAEEERQRIAAEEMAAKVNKVTFAQFWTDNYWPLQASKSERGRNTEDGFFRNWIKPALGKKTIAHLKPIDIERLKLKMKNAGRSPRTIKYCLDVIRQVWNLALRDGFVTGESPTKQVKVEKRDNQRTRFLSREEAELLFESLKSRSQDMHDMALMSLHTGMRFGEVASLGWNHVDFANKSISIVDTKSKKNRTAYISKAVDKMLTYRLSCSAKKTGLIFPGTNGTLKKSATSAFKQAVNRLFNQDVTDPRERVSFHTLRHTFASWLVIAGESLYSVKELLGHSDFKMTQRYSHLAPEGLRKAVRLFDEEEDQEKVVSIESGRQK